MVILRIFVQTKIMLRILSRYTHWLHTQWPAGHVEKLPIAGENGETNVPGIYVTGDLTGVPLLKFALQSGARTVAAIDSEPEFRRQRREGAEDVVDVAIIGAGVSGCAAAVEASKRGLSYALIEANRPLSTLINFPKAKPIYTYPVEMIPDGGLQVSATLKEALIEELESQISRFGIHARTGHVDRIVARGSFFELILADQLSINARRVVVAIGKSGNHRKLGVPGEDLDKVFNRLHDPKDFAGKKVMVVGGGDSALEAAIALAEGGANVTLSYRKAEFSRPKAENIEALKALQADSMAEVAVEDPVSDQVTTAAGDFMGPGRKPGRISVLFNSHLRAIHEHSVLLTDSAKIERLLPNDVVFAMVGREAPLEFFRRSGIRIHGELSLGQYTGVIGFLVVCIWMYLWKAGGNPIANAFVDHGWFPYNLRDALASMRERPQTLIGTLAISMGAPSFYYGLVYSLVVLGFGIKRIRRRKTPYVAVQTWTLITIQIVPLFLLPTLMLPWLGHNHLLPGWLEDTLFPVADYDPHGREYWRISGIILAWPLFIHNVFTNQPLWGWLIISFIQTFVLIPGLIYYFGKGAYCGWICSCGALAETLGDTERAKMPHGPFWNRLNMVGQAILAFTFLLLFLRILGWMGVPGMAGVFYWLKDPVYKFAVDVFLSGILGVGLYFWFSGRVWCRFACPLAALMHIYARFSRFRILPEKKKCISCNVCTSVCHQGIDVMNFANKGLPMADPECVRCSACVQSCPTGVLSFGQVDRDGTIIRRDRLAASPLA
jgi:thioredoxin reductase/NAD-dependent dihydropyrimidine dehydrogenase PreA subunit